jgi:hypothetical protein
MALFPAPEILIDRTARSPCPVGESATPTTEWET